VAGQFPSRRLATDRQDMVNMNSFQGIPNLSMDPDDSRWGGVAFAIPDGSVILLEIMDDPYSNDLCNFVCMASIMKLTFETLLIFIHMQTLVPTPSTRVSRGKNRKSIRELPSTQASEGRDCEDHPWSVMCSYLLRSMSPHIGTTI
jgi:hypothetical protein